MLSSTIRYSSRQLKNVRFNSTVTPVATAKKSSSLRGVLFGFLTGVTITGFGSYYYLMDEYKSTSNDVVSEVLLLQKSIRKLEGHVRTLEDALESKK